MKSILWKIILSFSLFLLFSFGLHAQTVSGIVTSTDGETLIGVNIIVKGSANGTISDINGNYSIEASNGDVLVFSYTGMSPQEVTVSGSTVDVQMRTDATSLSDIVVTATRQPIRKIQTTTAISSVGAEELKTTQAESFAEAIQATPGITVENSQGRKANYNIRGFPSGNTYITTMLDGLPLSGFASRSAGVAEYHGIDKNIERIEVVRGSGATLFGRAAAAGAVNIITKTGGQKLGGTVSATYFNNVMGEGQPNEGDLDYRVDFNLNGPISDKWRFNVGGYLMTDSGYKEWAIKDKGRQIRANVDYLLNKNSTIRFYAMYGDNEFNNLTDIPFDLGKGELAEGWENFNTFYPDNSQLDFESELQTSVFAPAQFSFPILDVNGNKITQNQAEDNREDVEGGHIGISADFGLGDGWRLVSKVRLQQFDWRDQNEISLTSFYNVNSNILRLNANSIGNISDVVAENRLQKTITKGNAVHNLSFGHFYSTATYDRFGGLHWYTSDINPRPTYGWFGPPGTAPPTRFTLSSTTSHQKETVTGFFVGDEMVFNEKLSLNVGVRYDEMTGAFDNDPHKIGDIDYDPSTLNDNELEFSDFSWSIGANYLMSERSAVYGSVLRAFSLPSVGLATPIPDENEIVQNYEIGYRAGIGDLGIDLGVFYTNIDNRQATVFDPNASAGQTFVTKSVGRNTVTGGELQLTYAPQAVKGLLLRVAATLQQSQFKDFEIFLDKIDHDGDELTPEIPEVDINNLFGLELKTLPGENNYAIDVSGNQVHNTPTVIFTFNANYNSKYFGLGLDGAYYGGRYVTALNIYEAPDLTNINANIYGNIPVNGKNVRVGLRIRNLLDTAHPQQLVLGSTNDDLLVQKQATPDFDGVLGFGIVQIPRRVLVTVSYDF